MRSHRISYERHSREGGNPFIVLEPAISMGPRLRGDDAAERSRLMAAGIIICRVADAVFAGDKYLPEPEPQEGGMQMEGILR